MANFLNVLIDILAYDSLTQTNDPADSIKAKQRLQESNFTAVTRLFPASIANSVVDQNIALPNNPSDYLVIFTDQQVSIKLNGISTPIVLNPQTAGMKTPAFFMRGVITSLTVSNASGTPANMDIIAVQL